MASKLGIRGKLFFVIAIGMALSAVAISTVIALQLRRQASIDAEAFRSRETERVRTTLRGYVDIAYETVDSAYRKAADHTYLEQRYGPRLRNVIDMAESVIRERIAQVQTGELSPEQAQLLAAQSVAQMRYDDGTGYLWINDMGAPFPKMVMHPTVPALNGTVLDNPKYNCALGEKENLFRAFVDTCREHGEGFVDYLWPKPGPDGLSVEQPKLSYVRRIPEWDWVIGTGIYIDDALHDCIAEAQQTIERMRYDAGVGYFWINDMGAPFPKMVMHPTAPALNGTVLDNPKYNCALGKKQNLFQAFVDTCRDQSAGFIDYLWPKPTAGGLTTEQPKISYVKLHEPLGWVIGTGAYVDEIETAVLASQRTSNATANRLIRSTVMVSGGVLLSAMALFWWVMGRSVLGPLRRSFDALHQISQGDLTQQLPVRSSDEFGKLAETVNHMTANLRVFFLQVRTAAKSLRDASASLAGQTADIAASNEQASVQSTSVATAAEELSATVTQVATSASQVNQVGAQASRAAADGSVVITEAIKVFLDIAQVVEEGADAVGSLAGFSTRVGGVIEAIQNIADQTNLLALNAAIEAARAGVHGRGFAVVADEVRKLAEKTVQSTKEITQIITTIQAETEGVAATMDGGTEAVASGKEKAERAGQAITTIQDKVATASQQTEHIATATEQMASMIQHVAQNMEQIALGADQNSRVVHEISATVQALSVSADQLEAMTQQFKL